MTLGKYISFIKSRNSITVSNATQINRPSTKRVLLKLADSLSIRYSMLVGLYVGDIRRKFTGVTNGNS